MIVLLIDNKQEEKLIVCFSINLTVKDRLGVRKKEMEKKR